MGKSKTLNIPHSENVFIASILGALKKRSKSLKHNCWGISVDRVIEEFEDGRLEKLEIDIRPSNYNAKINAEVWEDRVVHLWCWERTKIQKWDWERRGKLLPVYDGTHFVAALEATIPNFFQMTEPGVHRFDPPWAPLLASGLKLVP